MSIINVTKNNEADDIFAKNLRKAINEVKLQEPVMEQSVGQSGSKEILTTPPQAFHDPALSTSRNMTVPQIAETSISKARNFLVTTSVVLRSELSASPWNEKLREANRDIEEALSELDHLANTMRKFNLFGDVK